MNKPILYKCLKPLIDIFIKLYRPQIVGSEFIPRDNRVILAGNHTSYLDCLLLISSTKRCIHFMAKDSLTKGIKKIIFNHMGIIPVNREVHDGKSLKEAISYLRNEEVIGIFPEGTINRTNDTILEFKKGTVKMAIETGATIVPFVIKGKFSLLKKSVSIEFLKPITIKSDDILKENQKLMRIIKKELER